MSRKTKRLGAYVRDRKQRHARPERVYFHVSTAPRKVLVPRRTPYQEAEPPHERRGALLFLSPRRHVRDWIDWVLAKRPGALQVEEDMRRGRHVLLYVHVVVIDPAEVHPPAERYCGEVCLRKAVRPAAIVPVRVKHFRIPNMARVWAAVERVKARRRDRARDGRDDARAAAPG